MSDEMKMEIASTGNYGYWFDCDEDQKVDDGDLIDYEYEQDEMNRLEDVEIVNVEWGE